jgi:hypothetical protein
LGFDHYIFCVGPVDIERRGCWLTLHPDEDRQKLQPPCGVFLCRYNISTGELVTRSPDWEVTDLPHVSQPPVDDEKLGEKSGGFMSLVSHWCPQGCRHEDPMNQLARAFLQAVACVEQYRLKEAGEQPVRPLHSFPMPTYTNEFIRTF